ncbi:histone deacetylase 6 isoform X1 [Leptidea sinapis]|uniref:histone deacetylase 6 isoform X1 n=1 Tax=Leptidea sinapis TaxID=189913 RepID=UPI0021211EB0|nr:histone deacetylase 6 isoform X1 [Leptidea sinapis]
MSTPILNQARNSGGESKIATTSIVTRNAARKAKIQTRAAAAGKARPSALIVNAKRKAQLKKRTVLETVLKDHYQIAMDSKMKVKGATGLVTDPRMLEHRCLWDDNYPENPERLKSVLRRCQELNLIDQCKAIRARPATKEEIIKLHCSSVIDVLESTNNNNNMEYLEELSSRYDAIYFHPSTHELALLAAGSCIELVDAVVRGDVMNGAALVRPPGHHAMRAEPCGYCFYNNVALAAAHAVHKLQLNRILIVDWDVHHGQATQQMFYDDPRVVYFSIHRYEHGTFWPNLRESNFDYVGAGPGAGRNFNVPLNKTGMGDADYLAIWHQLLLPMAYEYQPELVLISAGYDAAFGCPEGLMEVTPACYATLTHLLMGVTSRVCVVLEGGYCARSLGEGAALTLRTLLGHSPPTLQPLSEPSDEIRTSILNCIYTHKKYWRCFNYQPSFSSDTTVKNVCDVTKVKHNVTVQYLGDETKPAKYETRNCYPVQDEGTKRLIEERLAYLESVTDLTLPQHAVGYVYDSAMLKHENICEPGHVECPDRILRMHERHREFGLLARLHIIQPMPCTDDQILRVHNEEHLKRLKNFSTMKLRDLNQKKESFDSVYFHPDSLESAAMAAGCAVQMVDAVLSGRCGAGVCVVRPPGHHAGATTPCGFCLLNNAVVAATHAVTHHGVRRVLLVDWDVHHGNGTQDLTYDDSRILYLSIHRYDKGAFFPQSRDADVTAVGAHTARGFNVNVPWNKRGMGDAEYLAAFTQVVLPIAYEYNPELVIVSAGFDAAINDPLGKCNVTPECYGIMTHMLRGLAGGRVVLCLEGGYNITSSSYAMTMCTKALLGDPILRQYDPNITCHPSAVESINDVIQVHSKYWKSLKFQLALPIENVLKEKSEAKADSLDSAMGRLSLSKCSDGIHCGTDDEDETGEEKEIKKENEVDPGKEDEQPNAGGSGGKQTLVDFLADNMQAIADGEMFAVVPLASCPHLETLYAIPSDVAFRPGAKCEQCDHTLENWVCLHCYVTACGRPTVNGHMQAHYSATHHPLSLSLADLSVWCYPCDAYVDNPLLYDAKNNAHRCKFGEDMPWCYRDTIDMH